MSVSQRIGKKTKEKINELQAKIILLKKQKLSITEILDMLISFSIQNENEFLKFLSEKEKQKENAGKKRDFINFILTPIEGAGPVDYEEYDYDEE